MDGRVTRSDATPAWSLQGSSFSAGVRFSVQTASFGSAAYNRLSRAALGCGLPAPLPPLPLLLSAASPAAAASSIACSAVVSGRARELREAQNSPDSEWLRLPHSRGSWGSGMAGLNAARSSCWFHLLGGISGVGGWLKGLDGCCFAVMRLTTEKMHHAS